MRKLATTLSFVLSLAGAHSVVADQHNAGHQMPNGEITDVTEAQATVTAIDQKTRMVTLKGPEGKETTIHVDKRAHNLSQVKVGDIVKVGLRATGRLAGCRSPVAPDRVATCRQSRQRQLRNWARCRGRQPPSA